MIQLSFYNKNVFIKFCEAKLQENYNVHNVRVCKPRPR